jgi:hypothetical protein
VFHRKFLGLNEVYVIRNIHRFYTKKYFWEFDRILFGFTEHACTGLHCIALALDGGGLSGSQWNCLPHKNECWYLYRILDSIKLGWVGVEIFSYLLT